MKGSYVDMVKNKGTNQHSVAASVKQSTSKYWVIKNLDVCKIDFDNL